MSPGPEFWVLSLAALPREKSLKLKPLGNLNQALVQEKLV
jgi:hypothetical protein